MRRISCLTVTVALLVALVPALDAATIHVANDGLDTDGCGIQIFRLARPACRSIGKGIANAAPGDTIIVGPGVYSGDLDQDGIIGEPGEETGSPGCGCMLSVNKSVILLSSDGAAATVIDARRLDVATNVLLILDGGEFGRPGKGFTVTDTATVLNSNGGIVIDSTNVKVRGNQVISTSHGLDSGGGRNGILALYGGPILIEGNQVMGWIVGMWVEGTDKIVRKNQVSLNGEGIFAPHSPFSPANATIIGNVITDNTIGLDFGHAETVVGNSIHGSDYGVRGAVFTGAFERNNVFGNRICGLKNYGQPDFLAANNYWGAASGPGPDPADEICHYGEEATTIVEPFATSPFTVRATIRP